MGSQIGIPGQTARIGLGVEYVGPTSDARASAQIFRFRASSTPVCLINKHRSLSSERNFYGLVAYFLKETSKLAPGKFFFLA